MKKAVLILFLAFGSFSAALPQAVKHVVLISIDGFRPDFYLDPGWGAVNLRQMMKEGVYAQGVRSVFPSFTYPSHTTIVTGALPVRHGIYYNQPFEPGGPEGRWYWEFSRIKAPTLWEAAHKAGLTSAAISWPVTVGAPINYNIPETWPWPNGSNLDRLSFSSKYATPAGLFEELQQNATGKLAPNDYNLDYLGMDENVARMAAYLIRTYKPGLVALHMACVDHNEHEHGREGEEVKLAIAGADRAVRTILEALDKAGIKDSTAVIVMGDHGFVDIHTQLLPNVWLKENGFSIPSGAHPSDWTALFNTTGGSAFLHLKDPADSVTLRQVRRILSDLPESKKKLFRVLGREELTRIGADPDAALALAAVQGICFGASEKGPDIKAASGGTHGYYPDFREIQTGFIGYGPGFKKGAVIPLMGLEDVAPLIAHLLGIPFNAPDGVLYPGLLSK